MMLTKPTVTPETIKYFYKDTKLARFNIQTE